jgi:hypothetical protein
MSNAVAVYKIGCVLALVKTPMRTVVAHADSIPLCSATDASVLCLQAAPGLLQVCRHAGAPESHFLVRRAVRPQVRLQDPPSTHLIARWVTALPKLADVMEARPAPADPEPLFARMRAAQPHEGWYPAMDAAQAAFLAERDSVANWTSRA